jgi:hypothetical protein
LSIQSPPRSRSEINRRNARARWGPRRIVRLDELDPDTQRLIRALIANAEAESAEPRKVGVE